MSGEQYHRSAWAQKDHLPRLFGATPGKAALFARVKDHGRAESALIAIAGVAATMNSPSVLAGDYTPRASRGEPESPHDHAHNKQRE